MSDTLIRLMNSKFAIATLCAAPLLFAAPTPKQFYAKVERHLQELQSLEIRYTVSGVGLNDEEARGRMIWIKPDRYYHDTPEWTHCEVGNLQWRYLKKQNTLILDRAGERSEWQPENLLLSLNKALIPVSLDVTEEKTVLTLLSDNVDAAGKVTMEFEGSKLYPVEIEFSRDDGTDTHYQIGVWDEHVTVSDSLFMQPVVPAENKIDFRTTRGGE
jgi:outer membrane lipoprotein-sorting protein